MNTSNIDSCSSLRFNDQLCTINEEKSSEKERERVCVIEEPNQGFRKIAKMAGFCVFSMYTSTNFTYNIIIILICNMYIRMAICIMFDRFGSHGKFDMHIF